jgi:hypothetical protein
VFAGPSTEQLAALEARLATFYVSWLRGEGARVFPHRQGSLWQFLVQHGGPCQCAAIMKQGVPDTLFYQPRCYDVLNYDPARGELAVHCCAERERRVLLRHFGSRLFGHPDFFPGTDKYNLLPILRLGRACLACADVPALESVRLVEVELEAKEAPRHRGIFKAHDIFELVESGALVWPADVTCLKRARLQVKFWQAQRPRGLTIVPSNRVTYGRESDRPILERLL